MDNQAYRAPEADIELSKESTVQTFQYFNWKGRIGRLRYLQLAFLLPTVAFFGYGFLVLLLMNFGSRNPVTEPQSFDYLKLLAWGLPVILMLGTFNGIWLSIQRAHDMGYKGWWAISALLPLLGAFLMVMPGDSKPNQFGQVPEENSLLVKITGWLGLTGVGFYYLLVSILVSELF